MRALVVALGLAWVGIAAAGAPDARTKAFLEAWLRAQNDGNFAAYRELYAETFHGVRRSGKKALTFDRAGWLADRERMFKKKMVVKASEVDLDKRELRFTQEFEQGRYHDTGKKVLTLEDHAGTLLIAGEELLDSQPVPQAAASDGCPSAPQEKKTSTDDMTTTEVTELQATVGKACVSVALTEERESNGETETRQWNAKIVRYNAGREVESRDEKAANFAQVERFAVDGDTVVLEWTDAHGCYSSGISTDHHVKKRMVASTKGAPKTTTLSDTFFLCPPSPEGLSSCQLNCEMDKFHAIERACTSDAACDKAQARYDAKHKPCSEVCDR
jgi:hypothetical protein